MCNKKMTQNIHCHVGLFSLGCKYSHILLVTLNLNHHFIYSQVLATGQEPSTT